MTFKRNKKVKKTILVLITTLLLISTALAGYVSQSPYDKLWTIQLSKCDGTVEEYKNCAITNLDEYQVSFIPNQTRVQGGEYSQEIIVMRDSCTSLILISNE